MLLALSILAADVTSIDTLTLSGPGDKAFEVRATLPEGKGPFPVIVFSHGMGGSKDGYRPLATYWAEHGYAVFQPTHADSLSKVPIADRPRTPEAIRAWVRGPVTNWRERADQVKAVIDALPKWNREHPDLKGRLDSGRIGLGGHSFGAHTTQLLAGVQLNVGARSLTLKEPRAKAFLLISPQGTGASLTVRSWENCDLPTMVISGDKDDSPRGGPNQNAEWRREVYNYLPAGDKFLVWIKDAPHSFGGISQVRNPMAGTPNSAMVETVQISSLAFFDAYVKREKSALETLKFAKLSFPHPTTLSAK